jgi:hypothetical protein
MYVLSFITERTFCKNERSAARFNASLSGRRFKVVTSRGCQAETRHQNKALLLCSQGGSFCVLCVLAKRRRGPSRSARGAGVLLL